MFSYRVLLIDTEVKQERPVQALFMHLKDAEAWAAQELKTASEKAEVVFYWIKEVELGVMKQDDTGSIPRVQPAAKEAVQRQ